MVPWRENETSKDTKYPYWTLGSWYHPWHPETRENVLSVIEHFEKPEGQVETKEERTQFDPKVEGLQIDEYRNYKGTINHHVV